MCIYTHAHRFIIVNSESLRYYCNIFSLASLKYTLASSLINNSVMNSASAFIIYSTACDYPSCLLLLHVNTFCGMFVVRMLNFDIFVWRQEDTLKDQRRIYGTENNVLRHNRFMLRCKLPFLWENWAHT